MIDENAEVLVGRDYLIEDGKVEDCGREAKEVSKMLCADRTYRLELPTDDETDQT